MNKPGVLEGKKMKVWHRYFLALSFALLFMGCCHNRHQSPVLKEEIEWGPCYASPQIGDGNGLTITINYIADVEAIISEEYIKNNKVRCLALSKDNGKIQEAVYLLVLSQKNASEQTVAYGSIVYSLASAGAAGDFGEIILFSEKWCKKLYLQK